MNDTVSGGNHHKGDDAQSSTPVDIPAELIELRDLAATASENLATASARADAALAVLREAEEAETAAANAERAAGRADTDAQRDFVEALKRLGYVQTADGLKPRDPQ